MKESKEFFLYNLLEAAVIIREFFFFFFLFKNRVAVLISPPFELLDLSIKLRSRSK